MPTRRDDEKTLHVLDLHRRGHSHAAIARATGLTITAIRKRIARVRREDTEHDPDHATSFWQQKPRKDTPT